MPDNYNLARPPRRKERILGRAATEALLERADFGTLATADSSNWPYATPMSYVFRQGVLYLHTGPAGHKIDNLRGNARISFAVVSSLGKDYRQDSFHAFYESAVLFGEIAEIVEPAEKRRVLAYFMEKYFPERLEEGMAYIDQRLAGTIVYQVKPEKITGKGRPELD